MGVSPAFLQLGIIGLELAGPAWLIGLAIGAIVIIFCCVLFTVGKICFRWKGHKEGEIVYTSK